MGQIYKSFENFSNFFLQNYYLLKKNCYICNVKKLLTANGSVLHHKAFFRTFVAFKKSETPLWQF